MAFAVSLIPKKEPLFVNILELLVDVVKRDWSRHGVSIIEASLSLIRLIVITKLIVFSSMVRWLLGEMI